MKEGKRFNCMRNEILTFRERSLFIGGVGGGMDMKLGVLEIFPDEKREDCNLDKLLKHMGVASCYKSDKDCCRCFEY